MIVDAENMAIVTPSVYLDSSCDRLILKFNDLSAITTDTVGPYGELNAHAIILSDSVTSIASNAFSSFGNLTEIYYMGTAEQFASISVGTGNNNFKKATVYYYSEATPGGAGNYWHDSDGNSIPNIWGE